MNRTIVLVGKSASGKSKMEQLLTENFKYEKGISHTTRPIRSSETDGIDYYFINKKQFEDMIRNDEIVEYTMFNDWYYGLSKKELEKKNLVLVFNPHGLRNLKKLNIPTLSILVKVDQDTRISRQLARGDKLMEVALRNERDDACFQGIEDEVDYIIDNSGSPEDTLKKILEILAID